jgi:hypothetical protein
MSHDHPLLRQISVPKTRVSRASSKYRGQIIGIAVESPLRTANVAPVRLDTTFPPNIPPPVNLTNNGGAIGTADPVQLIFWGSAWNQSSTNPSAGAIIAAVQTILKGPYMSGLRQYGVKRCSFGDAVVVTAPGPPSSFDDGDVQDLIILLIESNDFPPPVEERNLFCVFMPPGTTYSPGGVRGSHSATGGDFAGIAWLAWIGNNTLSQITSTFCHELAEMCSDPEGDAWTVDGQRSPTNEIGDVCNLLDAPLSGVNVESYWSIFDNACLIPSAWSLRRTLAGAGKRLNGRGLRSVQDPIPSLNQFVVNL